MITVTDPCLVFIRVIQGTGLHYIYVLKIFHCHSIFKRGALIEKRTQLGAADDDLKGKLLHIDLTWIRYWLLITRRGGSRWGAIGAIVPPKIYENNFILYDFLQLGKQHSRYKAILSSIVLSQQCCKVYFIPLAVTKPLCHLTSKITEITPPILTG